MSDNNVDQTSPEQNNNAESRKKVKAVALLSGGLDSELSSQNNVGTRG